MSTLTKEDEIQLIYQAQNGDTAAFSDLVKANQQSLQNMLLAKGVHINDVEGICQDAFLRAWKAIKRFKQKSSFLTWMVRIALNRHRDIIRSRKTRIILVSNIVSNNKTGEDFDIYNITQTSESLDTAQQVILDTIKQLPTTDQRILFDKHINGLSDLELGEKYGTSQHGAMALASRAKATFLSLLTDAHAQT